MRVLIVIPYFTPAVSYGGPVRVAHDTARSLVSRGHEVTVATTDVFDDKVRVGKRKETINGIHVVRFRNISNYAAKFSNGYTPVGFPFWLARNLRRFDVVYCHDVFSLQSVCVGVTSRLRMFPIVVQPHGSLSAVRRSARFQLIKKTIIRLFPWALRNAYAIIALTGQERKEIAAVAGGSESKIVVIPNGLELREFEGVEAVDLFQRFGVPTGRRVVGFVGRLAQIKGLDVSLRVLRQLRDRVDFSYLVIGPDEGELEALKQQVRELDLEGRVVFAGILEGRDKLNVMNSCDVFLFTSRDEGLPMTVLEVAALGIPQVLSAECNVPEVAEFRAGFVHPLGDADGLAGSLEILLRDKATAQEMSRNARAMVEEKFDALGVHDRIEQLLLKAVSGNVT